MNVPQEQTALSCSGSSCPGSLPAPTPLCRGELRSLQISASSPALPHNRGCGNRARPPHWLSHLRASFIPFLEHSEHHSPPRPPTPMAGAAPRRYPGFSPRPRCTGSSSPAGQHRAVSLLAARPSSEDACGCACIACAGILGGKSAKNTSEAPLPGKRGFVR